jgi:hypothetical protein
MSSQYPSPFIQQYPTKLAFLIDCVNGLNSSALSSRFIDNFPPNSDIFLFSPDTEPGMARRLKRIESGNHGVFFFSTSEYGIGCSISFLLGQISDKYNAFILITRSHPAFEDLCRQLITQNAQLRNHVQVRAFERINEFEQFLREMTRLHNDDESKNKKENQRASINYSRKHLFHACPLESKQESTILYRFGELLQHLDNEHSNLHYDYCAECQELIENSNTNDLASFEDHLRDKHWQANGFHINIRPASAS